MRTVGHPDSGVAGGWAEDKGREGYGSSPNFNTPGGGRGANLRDGGRPRSQAADEARRAQFESALAREDVRGRTGAREAARAPRDGDESSILLVSALSGNSAGASALETPAAPAPAAHSTEGRIAAVVERVEQAVREELFLRAGEAVSLRVPLASVSAFVDAVTVSVTGRGVEVSVAWLGGVAAEARQEALQGLLRGLQARFGGRRVSVCEEGGGARSEGGEAEGLPGLSGLFRQAGDRA